MHDLTDAELVPHLNEMCPKAWRELYRRYYRYIRKCAREVCDFMEIEDVEQECFLFLIALVPDLKPVTLRPLIAAVTKNIIRAARHKIAQIHRTPFLGWNVAANPIQIRAIEEETLENNMMELLKTVTPNELAVILEVYYRGYTPKEAGERLKITELAVNKRLALARARMARRIALESLEYLFEIPDECGPQTIWPVVHDEKIRMYFQNKKARKKRKAKRAVERMEA